MSQRRLWNRIIVGAGCFILSAVISLPFFNAWRDALAIIHPEPTPTQPVSGNNQDRIYSAFTVVWVDDFTKPNPLVDAIWIAWVPSDYSTIELEYLPTQLENRQYSHETGGVSLNSLPVQVQATFRGTVTFDRSDLGEVADLLGGIQLADKTLNAPELINYLTITASDHPDEILVRQAAVMQGLIAHLTLAGRQVSVRDLLAVPSQMTIDEQTAGEIIAHYYPLHLEAVHVRTGSNNKLQP